MQGWGNGRPWNYSKLCCCWPTSCRASEADNILGILWSLCDCYRVLLPMNVNLSLGFTFIKVVREDVFLCGLHHKTLNDWSLVKPVNLSFPSNLNESLNTGWETRRAKLTVSLGTSQSVYCFASASCTVWLVDEPYTSFPALRTGVTCSLQDLIGSYEFLRKDYPKYTLGLTKTEHHAWTVSGN